MGGWISGQQSYLSINSRAVRKEVRLTCRQADRQADGQADGQADWQADGQAGKQASRQTCSILMYFRSVVGLNQLIIIIISHSALLCYSLPLLDIPELLLQYRTRFSDCFIIYNFNNIVLQC